MGLGESYWYILLPMQDTEGVVLRCTYFGTHDYMVFDIGVLEQPTDFFQSKSML